MVKAVSDFLNNCVNYEERRNLMKGVMYAIDQLRGDVNNFSWWCGGDLVGVRIGQQEGSDTPLGGVARMHHTYNPSMWEYLCSYSSLTECIKDLSQAKWIKGASLEEYQAADKEVLKMENKTVEVDGMVYEIGKLYEFSDDTNVAEWCHSRLISTLNSGLRKFTDDNGYSWIYCRTVTTPLGTIAPAPVKLIDGDAYRFDYRGKSFFWNIFQKN